MSTPTKRDAKWTNTELETAYDALSNKYEELKKRNDTTLRLCERMKVDLDSNYAVNKSEHDSKMKFLHNLNRNLQTLHDQTHGVLEGTTGGAPAPEGDASAGDVGHEEAPSSRPEDNRNTSQMDANTTKDKTLGRSNQA